MQFWNSDNMGEGEYDPPPSKNNISQFIKKEIDTEFKEIPQAKQLEKVSMFVAKEPVERQPEKNEITPTK